jgi:hypothetical protein
MSLARDLADRMAKMLRLACDSGATDGEKLAAIGRLSTIAAAHDVDWDQALTNGNASGLNEEAASRIYWEGHARGCAETEQRLRPERDWTSTENTSSPVGEAADRLQIILDAAAKSRDAGLLSDWEATFSSDMEERFKCYERRLYVSERQWQSLDQLEAKLKRQSFIP